LFISFPSGAAAGITSLNAILTNNMINRSPTDITQTPLAGDFPPNALSVISLPILNNQRPPFGQSLRVAFHDWIKRAGPNLNVQSLFDAMTAPLSTSSAPHADVLKVSSGKVTLTEVPIGGLTLPVSNKQWYAVSGLGYETPSRQTYDVYCTDYVFQPGRVQGGIHAGEPLLASVITGGSAGSGQPPNTIQLNPSSSAAFPTGPSAGAVRPTYTALSIAIEIRVRAR
jgi:hypothetical protein